MSTYTGVEHALVAMLNNLIELDFDAVDAYDAALVRLYDESDKEQLRLFLQDHLRHTREIGEVIYNLGSTPAHHGDTRRILRKGKVVLAGLVGDRAILSAMKSNEEETNRAYELSCNEQGMTEHIHDLLQRNLADERRHRVWFEERLAALAPVQAQP